MTNYTYPLFKDKQWLEDYYVNSGLKLNKLCEIAGCSSTTILKYVNLYNLPKHNSLISHRIKNHWDTHPEAKKKGRKKYIDLDLLKIEYVDNKRTVRYLCEKFDSDYSTIKKCLDELNIVVRDMKSVELQQHMSSVLSGREHPWQLGDLNPAKRPEVRAKISEANRRNYYPGIYGDLNPAKCVNVRQKISDKLRGIPRPQTSGCLNGNWQGGISFEEYPQEFSLRLKERIRKLFNRKCFLCRSNDKENGRLLSIHHIDYNKKNNNLDNLIPLCEHCHGKTNYNRNFWVKEFKLLLYAYKLKIILYLR